MLSPPTRLLKSALSPVQNLVATLKTGHRKCKRHVILSRQKDGEESQPLPRHKINDMDCTHPRHSTLSAINFFVGSCGSPLPLYSIEQYPRYPLAFKIPNVFAKSVG